MRVPILVATLLIAAPLARAGGPASAPANAPELRALANHPMRYLISRPKGWTPGTAWPVVVVIDAAAREFRGNLEQFVQARGERPFILVAPFVVTGGGANYRASDAYPYSEADFAAIEKMGPFAFDESGLRAVIDDVAAKDGGVARPFLTGWEAGGHTVWALAFRHPEWWQGVIPVSPNYQGRWVDDASFSKDPARARLPIQVLFLSEPVGGAPGNLPAFRAQTDAAIAAGRAHGFTRIERVEIQGRPHGPLAAEVLDAITVQLGP